MSQSSPPRHRLLCRRLLHPSGASFGAAPSCSRAPPPPHAEIGNEKKAVEVRSPTRPPYVGGSSASAIPHRQSPNGRPMMMRWPCGTAPPIRVSASVLGFCGAASRFRRTPNCGLALYIVAQCTAPGVGLFLLRARAPAPTCRAGQSADRDEPRAGGAIRRMQVEIGLTVAARAGVRCRAVSRRAAVTLARIGARRT